MYVEKEASLNTARSLTDAALAENIFFDAKDRERFSKLFLGEITYEQLRQEAAIRVERVQKKLNELGESFLQSMAEAQVATLGQFKRKQARELRAVVKKLAGLLHFSWNGKFLAPSMYLPEGISFSLGAEPCPEYLVLIFQSLLVEGPNGQRSVALYAIETAPEILEAVFSGLTDTQSERPKQLM